MSLMRTIHGKCNLDVGSDVQYEQIEFGEYFFTKINVT